MVNKLIKLIKMAYWFDSAHCGGDFNPVKCSGCERGRACRHYDFCKLMREVEEEAEKMTALFGE